MPELIVVGIDIAKQTFDAALGITGRIETFANDDTGHDTLVARLSGLTVDLIVMEATGGLERDLACQLQAAGFAVAVINPRQARDVAKASPKPRATSPRPTGSTPRRWPNWPRSCRAIRSGTALSASCRRPNSRHCRRW